MASKSKKINKLKRKLKDLREQISTESPTPNISPLAPKSGFPTIPPINGVRFATAAAGIKYADRTDVMLAQLDPDTSIAGVFTKSATRAAPVLDCQEKIGGDSSGGAAILVNSGNANAFTGKNGQKSVSCITATVAESLGINQTRVFTSSTGVIGEPLPHDKITEQIDELRSNLSAGTISDAATAIMTTDTFSKGAFEVISIDGTTIKIAGIAKGSGMIAPDMATMLVYLFTDAKIAQSDLQAILSTHTGTTFNCITVDNDTSTSDTLLAAATGASGVDVTGNSEFADSLHRVMKSLAHQVVRDGEGATKFIEVEVSGAKDNADAHRAGLAIANSPLVKTAIAGEDPNWGRVVMAIGKSGAQADRDAISIWFGDILVAEKGWVSPSYQEDDGANYMKAQDLKLTVDLGIGSGQATVWTCDLTHGYITINADYRS